jgi:glycosyltransferase involved in cell wall biosynthesis
MAHGVPALIGNSGALPELAGGAAIEVDAQDVESIALGLEKLLSDAALRTRLGAEGMQRASEFTWDRAADSTLAVLRRISS